jgi:transcriptional regulator with XRE-family HTH domain
MIFMEQYPADKYDLMKLNGLSKNIRNIRYLGRYSLREFAEVFRVAPQTVANWEKGRMRWISFWGIIERIGREMKYNPSPVFEPLVSYIICEYKDPDYESNCKNIEIVAMATKGGASDEEVLELYKALGLDKLSEDNRTAAKKITDLILEALS